MDRIMLCVYRYEYRGLESWACLVLALSAATSFMESITGDVQKTRAVSETAPGYLCDQLNGAGPAMNGRAGSLFAWDEKDIYFGGDCHQSGEVLMKRIVVDLSAQTVIAYDGTSVFHKCDCVSGDSSHPTPTGHFSVTRKHHPYTSHTYHVPMNYALFFKSTGEALHQYHGAAPWALLRAGRSFTTLVGSHGCVRLQEADAHKLYSWAPVGTRVEVA